MKKIDSWKQFKVGGIYNMVYTGENAAYGRINGKQTFKILEIEPELKTVELFAQFGNPISEVPVSSPCTYSHPEIGFQKYDLFEPENESEWFVKSIRKTSLAQALAESLVTVEEARDKADRGSGQFIPSFGSDMKLQGVYCSFSLEGRMSQPMLQMLYIVWKTWEELYLDLAQHGVYPRDSYYKPAEKQIWKERRGEKGWSETTYIGLLAKLDGKECLIAELSHGLRVIPIVDPERFQFVETPGQTVPVPSSLIHDAKEMLKADTELQKQLEGFKKAIK